MFQGDNNNVILKFEESGFLQDTENEGKILE